MHVILRNTKTSFRLQTQIKAGETLEGIIERCKAPTDLIAKLKERTAGVFTARSGTWSMTTLDAAAAKARVMSTL